MPVWQGLVEPVALHIADAMEGALSFGSSEETASLPGMAGMEQMLRPMLRSSGASTASSTSTGTLTTTRSASSRYWNGCVAADRSCGSQTPMHGRLISTRSRLRLPANAVVATALAL